jgi:Zn-dependent protease
MIIVSFLIAMILHEIGHAVVAAWMGDPTTSAERRMSLSLPTHIDALGTLLCVILAFFPVGSSVGLGWGKPVKTDPWKLRGGPNVGMLIVALGGIFTSLLIGGIFAVVLRFLPIDLYSNDIVKRVPQLVATFASVNICLAIFNLIPLYPLDGYQILYSLLPSRQAVSFKKSATYGPFIILVLIFLLPFLPACRCRAERILPVPHLLLHPARINATYRPDHRVRGHRRICHLPGATRYMMEMNKINQSLRTVAAVICQYA